MTCAMLIWREGYSEMETAEFDRADTIDSHRRSAC